MEVSTMQLKLAVTAFFKALFDKQAAEAIAAALRHTGPAMDVVESPATEDKSTPVTAAGRNDAVTLLATLQREARFVDIVSEPLGEYSDAQIGAAARDVLRDCGAVLARLFELQPIVVEKEGAHVEVPDGYDAGRYRLTGNVSGAAPFHGHLVHHGWRATRCKLPQWSGTDESVLIVAPVEVEIQ
jgi:hypothetical protein